ncbi:accessory gene regulator ArgB-like protein [Porcipelethomonas sp.]|uniref:accessory gene regulator ArgB-like protein n=1 Tax=Porcipelethomonas sp. TaxID=2981675 RepID=UPI003EF71544
MFHNLAVDIAFLLIKNKIVDIQHRDVYVYGLEVILLNGSLLIVFLIASILCGAMLNFWAYLIFFLPIRIFSGGYHAKSSESCFVLSTIMYGLSIAITAFFPLLYQNWKWRVAGFISVIIILIFSPMVNENNPLTKVQQKRNRIIVCVLLTADLVLFILSCNFNWRIASNEIVFVILDAILLLIGKAVPFLKEYDE